LEQVLAFSLYQIRVPFRPGGKVILGNFHPRNSTKAFMDHVLDWRLIHRSEDDMNQLFRESAFRSPCSNIRYEEQGINLFAECIRRSE
jgi:extracellular factor (EF) 3-hydroxypalmitic acid methyl ester biosynthesis protein